MTILARLNATLLARGGQLSELLLKLSPKVRSGPFKGLSQLKKAHHSALIPKLLGTYEKELGEVLSSCIGSNPTLIINVGAAEGYYTVGLLLRLPAARAIAFEADSVARKILAELAAANSVSDRLEIRDYATEEKLFDALLAKGKKLLIMDVEGAELDLFSPRVQNLLTDSEAIVELHGIAKEALNFPTKIESRIRTEKDFPYSSLSVLWRLCPKRLCLHIMNEYRPEPQIWGIIKSAPNNAARSND